MFGWWLNTDSGQQWWPPGFREKAAPLLRRFSNRGGFGGYLTEYEIRMLQSQADGFLLACEMRSRIEVLTEIVAFEDLVHPADAEALEDLDEQLRSFHNDIPPPQEGEVPDWVPDSHWWWYVPSRHDMPWREREERLNDYFPELWTHD